MHDASTKISIVIPAKNEEESLKILLPKLQKRFPEFQILVVNDGSSDGSAEVCRDFGVELISHPYSIGNGAAIKTGARAAEGDIAIFMDADSQHDPNDIPKLLDKMQHGYDMVVGARSNSCHASKLRLLANNAYNRLASAMTGYLIEDLTSGFRAVRLRHFRKFLYLLPNGFSYPTTSTMAFFRAGLPVAYVPIKAHKRVGKSKIRLFHDGLRFLIIILKIGALFSPMRLFLPISAALFSTGLCYYAYTYIEMARFTNMSALLFISSLLTFLIGLLSEQVSALHYKDVSVERRLTRRD